MAEIYPIQPEHLSELHAIRFAALPAEARPPLAEWKDQLGIGALADVEIRSLAGKICGLASAVSATDSPSRTCYLELWAPPHPSAEVSGRALIEGAGMLIERLCALGTRKIYIEAKAQSPWIRWVANALDPGKLDLEGVKRSHWPHPDPDEADLFLWALWPEVWRACKGRALLLYSMERIRA